MTYDRQLPFLKKFAFVIIIIICLGHLAFVGKEILSPLLFSFLFAILLLPLTRAFENRLHFPRVMAALVSVIIFICGLLFIVYFLGIQLSAFSEDYPLLKQQFLKALHDIQFWIRDNFNLKLSKQVKYINELSTGALSASTVIVGNTFMTLTHFLLFMVFIFIFTFFLLYYRSLLIKFLFSIFRKEHKHLIQDIVLNIKIIIKKYVVGLFIEMAVVSAMTIITLFIVGARYPILLGLIAGILNVVPYLGIVIALTISFIITFATLGITKAIIVSVSIFAVHLIDSNFLMPKIVGAKVKINAFITVIGVFVGEMFWGIPGMFLSIPVIAIAKIIFDRVESLNPWGIVLGDEEQVEKGEKVARPDEIVGPE